MKDVQPEQQALIDLLEEASRSAGGMTFQFSIKGKSWSRVKVISFVDLVKQAKSSEVRLK